MDMKTIKFSSSSYRTFFSIHFLHLVGSTLTCSLCHPAISAAVGFAALLPGRWDVLLLPGNLVKHNGVKSQNIYCKLKTSPQPHILRATVLCVCSCKYNHIPIADLNRRGRYDCTNWPQNYKPPVWKTVKKKSAMQGVTRTVFSSQ